jgi:hypothetical protein
VNRGSNGSGQHNGVRNIELDPYVPDESCSENNFLRVYWLAGSFRSCIRLCT